MYMYGVGKRIKFSFTLCRLRAFTNKYKFINVSNDVNKLRQSFLPNLFLFLT